MWEVRTMDYCCGPQAELKHVFVSVSVARAIGSAQCNYVEITLYNTLKLRCTMMRHHMYEKMKKIADYD